MKISSIAAVLLIGTTAMMAETTSEAEEMFNEPELFIQHEEILFHETGEAVIEGTEDGMNTYYGLAAGYTNKGNGNSFFGFYAGYFNTGSYNTFSGMHSGYNNNTGSDNTFNGYMSGLNNREGSENTFMGTNSGYSNETGIGNTFIGYDSGYSNETGAGNTFIGYNSGLNNTTSVNNTFIGMYSGARNTTGSYNVFLGSAAGVHETGSNRLYIETAGVHDPDSIAPLIYGEFDNDLVRVNGTLETTWAGSNTEGDGLTNLLTLSANNSEADLESDAGFALRNEREGTQWNFRTHQNGSAFVATIAGTGGPEFTVKNPTGDFKSVELYLGNGAKNVGGVWINASSRALKENIKDLSTQDALAAFHKLQPVIYNYKTDKKEQVVGFIAEDVPELVAIQSRDGLSAMDMVAVLTKVVQEQEKNLKVKDVEIANLEARMNRLETILAEIALPLPKNHAPTASK